MTPIEQVREAGNAMRHWAERTYEEADRVARGYRVLEPLNSATESLKKRIKEWDRALSLLKTMEGEPVAWMEPASKFTMNADMKKALSSGHIKETCEADRFSIPLYASTHTKTITVDEILELVKENDMDAEGDESFTNESHWANLHNRLTSKFK